MMYKKLMLAVCAATLLVLQGCAGFAANKLEKVSPEQLHPVAEKKTKVFTRWKASPEQGNTDVQAAVAAIYKKRFEDMLSSIDCCSIVESAGEADVVIDGTAYNENNPAAMVGALITGFSLFTIPSWATITVHIGANATKGGVTRTYDASDSMTMVQWLPMALAFPFANPFPMEKEMGENVYRTILLKMKQDGVL